MQAVWIVLTVVGARAGEGSRALDPDPCSRFVLSAPSDTTCNELHPTASRPHDRLGVRVRLWRARRPGTPLAVVPLSEPVCNGDRVRFEVEASAAGFVTVMSYGTSGRWRRQYPPPGHVVGRMSGDRPIRVPAGERPLHVVGPAGTEYLLLLVSKHPFSAEFEQTISKYEGTWMPPEPGGIGEDNSRVVLLRGEVNPDQGWVVTDEEQVMVVPIEHRETCSGPPTTESTP